jgi:hypothetical protein
MACFIVNPNPENPRHFKLIPVTYADMAAQVSAGLGKQYLAGHSVANYLQNWPVKDVLYIFDGELPQGYELLAVKGQEYSDNWLWLTPEGAAYKEQAIALVEAHEYILERATEGYESF